MNHDPLEPCWNELKRNLKTSSSFDHQLESKIVTEFESMGPRRRFWRKTLLVLCCLLGTGIVAGVIADNIVLATPTDGAAGPSESNPESLLDYLFRHMHAHMREFHRHVHGE